MATRGSDQAYILYIWWSWSLTCLFSFQLNNSDLVKIMTKGNKLDQTVSETILWFAREFDSDARFENLNRTADRIRPKGNLNTVDDWRTILRTQVVPATTRALLIGFIGSSSENTIVNFMVMEMYRPTHTDERTFQEGPHTCNQANGPGLILEKYLINLLS